MNHNQNRKVAAADSRKAVVTAVAAEEAVAADSRKVADTVGAAEEVVVTAAADTEADNLLQLLETI